MKRITAVDRLETGQVLGADAVGADGACVALEGTLVDQDVLASLRAANLSTVMVSLSEADVKSLVSSRPPEDPESEFVLNDLSHPLIRKLVEVARELRA